MLIYRSADGSIKIDVRMGEETVWLTQDQMAALFGKAKSTITEQLPPTAKATTRTTIIST